jgi:lipoprotein-releasing system permease protein
MTRILLFAWRHIASRPRQSILTTAGVALGVAVFIFTVSMMDGLIVYFTQRLIRVSPLLTVLPESLEVARARDVLRRAARDELLVLSRPPVPDDRPTVRGAPALLQRIREAHGVEGASLAASTSVVLSFGTVAEPAALLGLDPEDEARVTDLPKMVTGGSWRGLKVHRDGAVVGRELADRLGVAVGDRVVAVGETGRSRELEVVGVLATGLGTFDDATAVVNLAVAQGLAGWGGDEASEIRIRSAAIGGLEPLRRRLEGVTGHAVETWEESNSASLQLFRTIGLTAYLLTGFVLIVAGLGIANRLTTVILDKERDIAVLRAMGFNRLSIRGVFLLEGVALGGAGAALGCVGAAVAIALLTLYPIHFAPREGSVMAYTELYLASDVRYYIVVAAAALLIAATASLLSVRRAVRVVPVEVLRGSV